MLSHLRFIGFLGYALVFPRNDNFSERSIPSILMGYSEVQKGYILLNIQSKTFFLNRDVVFKEDIFSFGQVFTSHTTTTDHSSMLLVSLLVEEEVVILPEEDPSVPVDLALDVPLKTNETLILQFLLNLVHLLFHQKMHYFPKELLEHPNNLLR